MSALPRSSGRLYPLFNPPRGRGAGGRVRNEDDFYATVGSRRRGISTLLNGRRSSGDDNDGALQARRMTVTMEVAAVAS